MSVRRLADEQPEAFAFTPENLVWAKTTLEKYPEGKQASGVIPLLWRAQEQMGGWLPEPALRYVADMLDMAYIRVYEVATFYTMFNLAPVGRHFVQLCGTTPCWLRGSDELKKTCREMIGEPGHVTDDGLFSWIEVECLGACSNAPMVQINKDYYEDLDGEKLAWILNELKEGREVVPGPQNGRQTSAPASGPTSLTSDELYEMSEDSGAVNPPLQDDEAKEPTEAASQRAEPVPDAPIQDAEGAEAAEEGEEAAKAEQAEKDEDSR